MKKIITVLLLICATSLLAHEFWLQPDKFIYKWNERINIKFFVGENFEGENWQGNRSRINSLKVHFSDVTDDLSSAIGDEKGDSLQLGVTDEGTAMVTFNNNNSFIELDPQKFNDYLKEDGLADALDYRQKNSEMDSAGREYYQRSVKTILQVGNKLTEVYKKQTDLPLDIILQSNPYAVKQKKEIKAKVLFGGMPLSNSVCKIWQRYKNNTSMKEVMTNMNGEISFETEPFGRWMVSTVKMVRLQDEAKAQWQSYWGSITWGYY